MLHRPYHNLIPEAYEERPYYNRLIKGVREEFKFSLGARHPNPANKFLIFAQGRSGSTLLTSTLDSHPEICCDDEILIVPRLFPRRFIENAARQNNSRAYGFHVKITQLHAWQGIHDIAAFLKDMESSGWRIIYLWRKNILRQVVSNIFAEAAGTYHMEGKHRRPKSISLPLERLGRELDVRTRLLEAEQVAVKDRNVFEINYERDLQSSENQKETFSALQKFIGVTNVPLSPRLQKMVVSPLSDLVENYDQVSDWIAAQPRYSGLLDL